MSGFPIQDIAWIYNSDLEHPAQRGQGVAGDHWVEVLHGAFSMDGSATWFYYAPGSGIFMWTGKTRVYQDHGAWVQDVLHQRCHDMMNECISQFELGYAATRRLGLDSVQFLKHADMQCTTF